ncbi:MAG: hypothetical protein F4Y47_02760 [Acidobacteriia bacterium]|nr:hypothetical protein [Terriglobia bacterium]MYG03221.1 hypothetical protein [Terriglobia bacterium]MYK12071.1 hypothetical protein [Terriglobia bacterium]
MTRPLTALVIVVLAAAASPLVAQQRKPRVEFYGLTEVYSPGVGRDRFSPQAGAGVLIPVGRNWAAVVDFGIGVVPVHTKFRYLGHSLGPDAVLYRRNPQLPNINEHWTTEATLRSSFVRVLRHDRISFWLGTGIGAEFEYNRWRHKGIREVHDKNGNAIPVDDKEPFGLLMFDEQFTTGDD